MREKLSQLEELRLLEPDEGERADVREAVINYTEKFLNEIGELDAYKRLSKDNADSSWKSNADICSKNIS